MGGSSNTSEELYFDVYDAVAEYSEYLQPSDKIRFLLPEIIVAAAVAAVFKGLLDGFLQRFGARLADASVTLVTRIVEERAAIWAESPEAIVNDIECALPELTALVHDLGEIRQVLIRKLTNLGLTNARAELLAAEIIILLQQRLLNERID